jgi:hypothetical protein
MKRDKAITQLFVMLLCSLAQHGVAIAASPSRKNITLGWSAVAGSQAPF